MQNRGTQERWIDRTCVEQLVRNFLYLPSTPCRSFTARWTDRVFSAGQVEQINAQSEQLFTFSSVGLCTTVPAYATSNSRNVRTSVR